MSDWFVARVKPSQEHVALENLQRQNLQTYFPQMQVERIGRNGRITIQTEGLFPGYVFIYVALEACAWRAINASSGMLRLLSCSEDGYPSRIPLAQIALLQHQERQGLFRRSEVIHFHYGDKVRIKHGLSNGQTGLVLRTRGERVEFLFNLLGSQVRCIAPRHALDLASPRIYAPVR